MNITKRITKFLLIAALAFPAWTSLSAQNRAVPPEDVSDKAQILEKAENQSVVTRKTESRPVGKSVSIDASNAPEPQPNTVKPIARMASRIGNSAPTLKAPMRADAVTVTPPSSAVYEVWEISTTWTYYDGSNWTEENYSLSSVQVAFDGDDVYISGLCYWIPNAWVKGTMNSSQTQVTFPRNQYYGILVQDNKEIPMWFVGLDASTYSNVIDVVFDYDKANHVLTLNSNNIIFDAGEENTNKGSSYHTGTVISKPAETVTVADGTDTGKVPVYLYALDYYNHGQVIYPADDLKLTRGSKIKSITFYANNALTGSNSSGYNNSVTIKVGETQDATYSSTTFISSNLTTVATVSNILTGDASVTFTFNEPYEYQGGNLVIDATTPNWTYSTYSGTYSYNYTAESVKWLGQSSNGSSLLYYSKSNGGNSSTAAGTQQDFLPKMTLVVDKAENSSTTELDFGTVNVESPKTLSAYIANDSDNPVTAAVTVEPNPPFSVASTEVTLAANTLTSIPVTFTPTDARNYNGTLTVVAGDVTTTIPLKGVGNISGPEAVRDSSFFAGITYDWTDSEGTHTSHLTDVATKPEQIIAMLKEVYTNKSIPGNFKRGCTAYGNFTESFSDVSYPAIGKIEWIGGSDGYLDDPTSYAWTDSYGWGIDTKKDVIYNKYTGYSSDYPIYYTHFDQTEYKPENEGVTLLLVEVNDDYDLETYTSPTTTGAQYLKDVISGTIKSVRVVTESKRTGTGEARGTLFNIDCDKMNKFFMMAKGQLRRPTNSMRGVTGSTVSSASFCPYPMYMYTQNYYGYGSVDKYIDEYNARPFYQMFEQFSPVSLNTGANLDDLYNSLTKMTTFNVVHDCITVPFATHTSEGNVHHGHQFMMYGVESGAADCQDVRDLMFFVPDYRMMDWGDDDGTGRDSQLIPYTNYNQSHAPKMGLYVIIQDSVEAVTRADSYFKLKLTWDSNMDEFLPGEKQEYQLYQVITDEFGVSKWVPVYKRNAQGQYWNPTSNKWQNDTTGAERVVLTLDPSSTKKTYTEVYELREQSSRYVTYAIRGCDTGHFLSLQMSNEESYLIPGLDPAEMALMSSATVYSRYEAQNENNCYSNKLLLKSAPRTIKASYLPHGSTMTINRTHRVMENGQSVEVTVPIATLEVTNSGSNKYFTVSGPVLDVDGSVKDLFPKGIHDGKTAGYHANSSNQIGYSTETNNGIEYINFDLTIWDNFVANVSKNEHPGLYTYQLRFNVPDGFPGLNNQTVYEAYSNIIPVFVYKTDSRINKPLTLAQVQADVDCNPDYEPGDVEFSAQVQLSSKSEILRYDAYRWNEGAERSIVDYGGETDEDEEDYDPNGIAGNQGDSYSVTMNAIGSDDYYVGNAVPVTDAAPQNWAKFVDYYPAKQPNGGAFTYAPVVELFTRGYVEGTTKERGDYNTYGGPLKTTAVGKLELEIPDNLNTAGNPFMSTYKWLDGEDWCAYYKIPVKFKVLGIPEGYELYKIRAWRDVDTKILREELTSRQDRIAPNYLFEELTYGDALGDGHTMSKANLYQNNDGTVNSYELGRRAVENYDTDSNIQGETHATFGALRINTKDNQPYSIDNLEATIKVRAYFTKTSNPILSDPIYVIADNGTTFDYDHPLATLICEDGSNFTGTITIPAASNGNGKGKFIFSKKLGSSWTNNPQYIFGPYNGGDGDVYVSDNPNNEGYNLKYWQGGTRAFMINPGTYQLNISSHVQTLAESESYGYQAGWLTITKANSKVSTRDEVPANFDYYVADGEVEFNSNMFNQIITGVTDVTTNSTREVMSVSYVNTIGQVSSTPWKGVNIVVTRYTDGSTSTTKVMK